MARPPSAANNITTGHARAGGVKHQVKPLCQRSVGVGHDGHLGVVRTFSTSSRACPARCAAWPPHMQRRRATRAASRARRIGSP